MAFGLGEEFRFPLSSNQPITFKAHHWQHPECNSAIDINGIEIDIYQWRVVAERRETVDVDLIKPVWEYSGWASDEISLPETIIISNVLNFRGAPIVYIKVTPWRIVGNRVEVLKSGEIRISVEPTNFPVSLSHPYLLNGNKHMLQRSVKVGTEYLIICPNEFVDAAQSLAVMHSIDLAAMNINTLNTKVLLTDDIAINITGEDIRDTILHLIQINEDLKFLLLLGNETHIPPIVNTYPSDDYYTIPEIDSGDPQLITGRIPISTVQEANTVVNKIRQYSLYPTPGIWRSKVALVADDMYRSCALEVQDTSHTTFSQDLYGIIKTLLPVLPYYGVHYSLQNCEYPDLTRDLLQTINNGIALINYIGHGSPESWAHEKIIDKSRDLPLIHSSENIDGNLNNKKLAIWVAGTCSFGDYFDEDSFMEDLLIKEDGAIAVIASTENVGYVENYNYLKALFNEISNYVDDPENITQLRLGEMVWKAKNGDKKFHTFGDPALPLPFPKKVTQNLIAEPSDTIHLVQEENILFNVSSQHSSILIRENENDYIVDYGFDSLKYMIPGETYLQMDFSGNSTCFRIPLDAGSCDSCVVIQAYQEDATGWNGKIETIYNISLMGSSAGFEDHQGPIILLSQENNILNDGSAIFPNMDLRVSIDDESGINLMGTIGHGIRYTFDDDNEVLVPGNEFIYTNCSGGFVKIPVPLSISEGTHQLILEAWDGLNNKTDTLIYFELLPPIDEKKLILSKVYPVPSLFSESTHFTMFISEIPSHITITIFSLSGDKVREIKDEADKHFFSIYWDGKDEFRQKIANGAYYYHVRAETERGKIFEHIYKLAKIE